MSELSSVEAYSPQDAFKSNFLSVNSDNISYMTGVDDKMYERISQFCKNFDEIKERQKTIRKDYNNS